MKFITMMGQHVALDPRLNIWKPLVRIPNVISWEFVMTGSPQGPNHRIWAQPGRLGPSVTRECVV